MSSQATPPAAPHRRVDLRRFFKIAGIRFYALIIMLVVMWTGYTAVAYLFHSVFGGPTVPSDIQAFEKPITVETLKQQQEQGLPIEPDRAPFAHYHGVGRFIAAEPAEGCTTSGCHGPLPHTKSKAIRAFANLHTTFMSCQMCHASATATPRPAMWVGSRDGKRTETPPLLSLIRTFADQSDLVEKKPVEVHTAIVRDLRKIVERDNAPPLPYLLTQLDTSEPGSPAWRHAVMLLRAELPNHARGEYAAVIENEMTDADLEKWRDHIQTLAMRYLSSAPDSPDQKTAYDQIHEKVLSEPEGCLACHVERETQPSPSPARGGTGELDFEALGYTAGRAAELRGAAIAGMVQRLREGQPFYLPRLLEGDRAR